MPLVRPLVQPKSNTLRRKVKSFNWTAGGRDVFDMPRGYDLASLLVEVTGTIQLTTAATTVSALAPAQLINKITLKANGNQTLDEVYGIVAAVSNFERQLQRTLTPPGTGIATHTVYAIYRLDRINADGLRPKDSALHTRPEFMNLLQLQLDYASSANAVWSVFGAGVLGTIALTVNVYVDEIQEYTGDVFEPRFIKRKSTIDISSAAATTALQQALPLGMLFRGCLIMALDSTNNEPSAKINNIIIKSGTNVRLDISLTALRAQNEADFGIQGAQLSGIPGLAYADLSEHGKLGTLMDARRLAELFAVFDVQANSRVIITPVNFDSPIGYQ